MQGFWFCSSQGNHLFTRLQTVGEVGAVSEVDAVGVDSNRGQGV